MPESVVTVSVLLQALRRAHEAKAAAARERELRRATEDELKVLDELRCRAGEGSLLSFSQELRDVSDRLTKVAEVVKTKRASPKRPHADIAADAAGAPATD